MQDYRGAYIRAAGQFRSYNRHEEKKNRLVLSVFVRELEFMDEEVENMQDQPDLPGWIYLQGTGLSEDTAWKRNCGYSAGGEPSLWKIGLHSVYLLGKKCQICIRF